MRQDIRPLTFYTGFCQALVFELSVAEYAAVYI